MVGWFGGWVVRWFDGWVGIGLGKREVWHTTKRGVANREAGQAMPAVTCCTGRSRLSVLSLSVCTFGTVLVHGRLSVLTLCVCTFGTVLVHS